jgi:hypothetical protein
MNEDKLHREQQRMPVGPESSGPSYRGSGRRRLRFYPHLPSALKAAPGRPGPETKSPAEAGLVLAGRGQFARLRLLKPRPARPIPRSASARREIVAGSGTWVICDPSFIVSD